MARTGSILRQNALTVGIVLVIAVGAGLVFLYEHRDEKPATLTENAVPKAPGRLVSLPHPAAAGQMKSIPSRPASAPPKTGPVELKLENLAGTLKLAVPELSPPDRRLPLDYTCYRANKSPPLSWQGAPPATRSFVLLLDRHDDARPDFLNWAIYNIKAEATALPAGVPRGVLLKDGEGQALNDHKVAGYVGPCDPKGRVKYRIRLFALNDRLPLSGTTGRDALIAAMNGHVLDMSEIDMVHFRRP